MDTTRRYPRTFAAAFPDVRAGCIERYIGHGIRAAISRLLRRIFD